MDNDNFDPQAGMFDDIFGGADDIFAIDPDEHLWDKLIQEIIDGNVVPVIGVDMLIDNTSVDHRRNLHQLIIDVMAKGLRLTREHNSFSDLIYDPDTDFYQGNKKDTLYLQMNKLFAQKRFEPSKALRKLLDTRMFPFVITTSFTPVVEQAMKQTWGDELRVMRFNNNPVENHDIKDDNDLRKPTVYYMFGKVGEGAHKYVLTDTDMLEFCSSWLSNDSRMRPKNLCTALCGKYLLMLGNSFSDWLFRFIWFSMRKSNAGRCMLAYDDNTIDQRLINFLERAQTFTKRDQNYVVDQLVERLQRKLLDYEVDKYNRPQENADVFISYSRSDKAIAERLCRVLTAHGKRVWYDKNNLTDGGNFMDEISKAIRTSKFFVPILTHNITNERNDSHVYRNEWDIAIDVATSMGRTYLLPVAEDGFDFYRAAIPEKLQRHNAVFFDPASDLEQLAASIIHVMNQD